MRARTILVATAAAATAVLLARLRPDSGADGPGKEPDALRWLADWQPQRPVTTAGRVLAYAWAAPVTFAGVLLGLAGRRLPTVREGVLVFADAGGPAGWLLRRRGFTATALGHAVIARERPSPALFAHELMHVRQAERLGVVFGPAYIGLLARYGYRSHPLERAARRAAG